MRNECKEEARKRHGARAMVVVIAAVVMALASLATPARAQDEVAGPYPVERTAEGASHRVTIDSYSLALEKLGEPAPDGFLFLVLKGSLVNKSAEKRASVPPAEQSFLLQLGDATIPLSPLSQDSVYPLWGEVVLEPGEERPFEMIFVLPDRPITSATLVQLAGEALAIPIVGEQPPAPTAYAAGPTAKGAAELAVASAEFADSLAGRAAPGGWRYLALELWYTNLDPAAPHNLDLAAFTVLAEDGHYVYAPDALSESVDRTFTSERMYLPRSPISGQLIFLVPADAGDLSLVHFTDDGPLALDLTPDVAAPPAPVVAAGPASGEFMSLVLYQPRGGGALEAPSENERYIVLDVGLELTVPDAATTFPFDPAEGLVLYDEQGQSYAAATPAEGLTRPLRPLELWRDQPVRGEVAFKVPAQARSFTLAVPLQGAPIELAVPEAVLATPAAVAAEEAPAAPAAAEVVPGEPVEEATAGPAPAAVEAEAVTASAPLVVALDDGTLEVALSTEAAEGERPVAASREISEQAGHAYLVVTSRLDRAVSVALRWVPVRVEEPDIAAQEMSFSLGPGERAQYEISPPSGGFTPGNYRVEVAIDGTPEASLPFRITALYPPAVPIEEAGLPSGFDLALSALGGKVESATTQYDEGTWAAANLIDGRTPQRSWGFGSEFCDAACGWSSADSSLPQEIVLSFHEGRAARIGAVVVDTASWNIDERWQNLPKHVELWGSMTSATDGFTPIAQARLKARAAEQVIAFTPAVARYLKLRIVSNFGGNYVEAMELKVIEAAEGEPSILADFPVDLALPELGGAIVRFTSQSGAGVAALIDDSATTDGWWSADNYLPQEVVFAFRDDRAALVDRIELAPGADARAEHWPRRVALSTSLDSPFDGFEAVGEFVLPEEPAEVAFPIGRKARFVKLRILENYNDGVGYTALGEVRLIEGQAAGYDSILLGKSEPPEVARLEAGPSDIDEAGMAEESEPNDAFDDANPLALGQFVKGTIQPLGESDHFALSLPEAEGDVLTVELQGRPNIRTSVALLDPDEVVLKSFDPGAKPARRAVFSWRVDGGSRYLKVTEPTVSMVLIWDTSGSMGGRTDDLKAAIDGYLDELRADVRLNLIRFSGDVEVLLPGFTADRDELKAAIEGKIYAEGGTAFYDAVVRAIELLDGVPGNRAIVVMTDGADSASNLSNPDFWRLLEEKRIRLYTIGLGYIMRDYLPGIGTSGERLLMHSALATNGRFFFAPTSKELEGLYQRIADELRAPSTYYVKVTRSAGEGDLSVLSTGERVSSVSWPKIELILDASGSMVEKKKKIDGKLKMDVAKQVIGEIVDILPDDITIALRVYGHRIREGEHGDCQDSELVVPFGPIDKPRLMEAVQRVKGLGTTPLAYSLWQAGMDFGEDAGAALIVLVTDGKEECGEKPAEVAAQLLRMGLSVRVNVVGFALAEEAVKEDMRRVAEITGGQFFDAQDEGSLRAAIEDALALPFDVVDGGGERVASGVTGRAGISLPQGVYDIVIGAADAPITVPAVTVAYDRRTVVELKKEGQETALKVQGPLTREEALAVLGPTTVAPASLPETPAAAAPTPAPIEEAALAPAPIEETVAAPPAPDPQVREAQTILTRIGYDVGPTDGVWGSRTEQAIAAFQARNPALESNGRLDAATAEALRVADAQWMLVRIGYDPGPIDGAPGRRTAQALADFQAAYAALEPRGTLDDATYAALLRAIGEGWRTEAARAPPEEAPVPSPPPPPPAAATAPAVDLVGEVMDDFDRAVLFSTFEKFQATRDEVTVTWENPFTARAFRVVLGATYEAFGTLCRDGDIELVGSVSTSSITACYRENRWLLR